MSELVKFLPDPTWLGSARCLCRSASGTGVQEDPWAVLLIG